MVRVSEVVEGQIVCLRPSYAVQPPADHQLADIRPDDGGPIITGFVPDH